ncbi:hypothetical protein [Ponticaulis koreensis]|uniref:hypothetical protein n=1 Tax=Ponticaulis koreensis TaxID=1123045 RepID=UPI0003B389E0|nr:hypothetical protein [Ponticaulis koreensis]
MQPSSSKSKQARTQPRGLEQRPGHLTKEEPSELLSKKIEYLKAGGTNGTHLSSALSTFVRLKRSGTLSEDKVQSLKNNFNSIERRIKELPHKPSKLVSTEDATSVPLYCREAAKQRVDVLAEYLYLTERYNENLIAQIPKFPGVRAGYDPIDWYNEHYKQLADEKVFFGDQVQKHDNSFFVAIMRRNDNVYQGFFPTKSECLKKQQDLLDKVTAPVPQQEQGRY